MKNFNGKVLFLDRSDINTDEIIPAKYLTENTKEALQPYLLEDLHLEGFDPQNDIQNKSVVITRANFGCGSSREHAPWALEMNGIHLVLAPSYARIFRQNMFNCGMMAIALPEAVIDDLFIKFADKETEVQTDLKNNKLTLTAGSVKEDVQFQISDFDRTLVEAGGWVDYADKQY